MKPVLVLGATGYVGARLVPCLRAEGYPVRAADLEGFSPVVYLGDQPP
jgi:nucleoside-diphosphate-sugar epimerase